MPSPLGLETRAQRAVFVCYMSLWVSYGLLNELAKRHHVVFNSASAVVLQSIIKLGLASYMFVTQDGVQHSASYLTRIKFLLSQVNENRNMIIKYFIPSGLYALYDVLSYLNLRRFDAATYFLLLQFRLVIVGLLHQLMFQRKLNRNQWISILVTTVGCTVKSLGSSSSASSAEIPAHNQVNLLAYALLMVQLLSSTFAGVYNEVLLKKQMKMSLNLQNVVMYLDSIVCLVVILALGWTGQSLREVVDPRNLQVLFSFYVFPMVLIMSFIGVVTSMFLKFLDSIRKAIASALELVFLPLLCAVFFGMPITFPLVVSVAMVGFGVYIYSKPVDSSSSSSSSSSLSSSSSASESASAKSKLPSGSTSYLPVSQHDDSNAAMENDQHSLLLLKTKTSSREDGDCSTGSINNEPATGKKVYT